MLKRLISRFVNDPDDVSSPATRAQYGLLAGVMGMILNFALFAIKLPIGIIANSAAITSDAFNNITDMGSSLVTVIGLRLAARKPDQEHPFGHGRMEYVATFIISMLILFVGAEMFKESIAGFLTPSDKHLDTILGAVLLISCAVKLFMCYYNRSMGKRISSDVLIAASVDSVSDAITTLVVVIAAALENFVDFPFDAIASLGVSCLILKNGVSMCHKTIDHLLGGEVDTELRKKIYEIIIDSPGVLGAHDLIVHDYGPGRVMASAHVEIDSKSDLLLLHEEINDIETRVLEELNVPCVIHMDPVITGNEAEDALFSSVCRAVYDADSRMKFHDLQVYDRDGVKTVEFDLLVPVDMTPEAVNDAVGAIRSALEENYAGFVWNINAETDVYSESR